MACRSKFLLQLLVIVLFWLGAVSLPAVTPPIPAQPPHYVVDLAGVLDAATRARLNARLKDLEAKTTAQVVVLTINSLDGEPHGGIFPPNRGEMGHRPEGQRQWRPDYRGGQGS